MQTIKTGFISQFGFLTILFVTFPVHGTLTPYELCTFIKYDYADVKNKPDFFTITDVRFYPYPWKLIRSHEICHVKEEAKLAAGSLNVREGFTNFENLLFAYDPKEKAFYKFSDKSFVIEKIDPSNGNVSRTYKIKRILNDIVSMDLDWNTKNLYLMNGTQLKVVNTNERSVPPKILFNFELDYTKESIVKVFSNENYLILLLNGYKLVRLDTDGSKPLVLYNNSSSEIGFIALDHYEKNVYWLQRNPTSFEVEIFYMNINGGKVKKFEIKGSPNYHVLSLYNSHLEVSENYVYYSALLDNKDMNIDHLVRAKKSNGEYDRDFGIQTAYKVTGNFHSLSITLKKFQIISDQSDNDYDEYYD